MGSNSPGLPTPALAHTGCVLGYRGCQLLTNLLPFGLGCSQETQENLRPEEGPVCSQSGGLGTTATKTEKNISPSTHSLAYPI